MKDTLVAFALFVCYLLWMIVWLAFLAMIYIAVTVGPLIILAWAIGKIFHLI